MPMIETLAPSLATRELAEQVAEILYGEPKIKEVYLFGSVAREGSGHDLDLILIADEETAETFQMALLSFMSPMLFVAAFQSTYGKGIFSRARLNIADLVLWDGGGFPTAIVEAVSRALPAQLDLFIFPPNWRERLPQLQNAFPNKDPRFMENIARDAVLIKDLLH